MNPPAGRNCAPHRAVPDGMTALHLPGHIRITIEAADPRLAERAAAQLTEMWHTGPPEGDQPGDGVHVVRMYARPGHPPEDDGTNA